MGPRVVVRQELDCFHRYLAPVTGRPATVALAILGQDMPPDLGPVSLPLEEGMSVDHRHADCVEGHVGLVGVNVATTLALNMLPSWQRLRHGGSPRTTNDGRALENLPITVRMRRLASPLPIPGACGSLVVCLAPDPEHYPQRAVYDMCSNLSSRRLCSNIWLSCLPLVAAWHHREARATE